MVDETDGDGELPADLHDASKDELLDEAKDRDIEGRSGMDKEELVEAVAEDIKQNPPRIG